MNHVRFRNDMREIGLFLQELKKKCNNDHSKLATIKILESKYDDIIKDVYEEELKKADWLNRYHSE